MKKIILCVAVMVLLEACAKQEVRDHRSLPEPLPESSGELLYLDAKCPVCHGYQGVGDGFLAEGLDPRPVDFTSLEAMSQVSDAQMESAIRRGKGSSMPAYGFTDRQVSDLVEYIRSLSH
jgi:high-affinity iron transporter